MLLREIRSVTKRSKIMLEKRIQLAMASQFGNGGGVIHTLTIRRDTSRSIFGMYLDGQKFDANIFNDLITPLVQEDFDWSLNNGDNIPYITALFVDEYSDNRIGPICYIGSHIFINRNSDSRNGDYAYPNLIFTFISAVGFFSSSRYPYMSSVSYNYIDKIFSYDIMSL